jgi:hypothetical protein
MMAPRGYGSGPQGRVVRVEEASLFEPAVQRGAAYASTPWCLTFA